MQVAAPLVGSKLPDQVPTNVAGLGVRVDPAAIVKPCAPTAASVARSAHLPGSLPRPVQPVRAQAGPRALSRPRLSDPGYLQRRAHGLRGTGS